jgi:hypothetical protein
MNDRVAPVVCADTVTRLDRRHAGCVLVTGSHGGLIAARYAAAARVRATIFNDAGVGLDDAGIAGLAWLDLQGVPAAAVSHSTARIADAADSLENGLVSHANAAAQALGVGQGSSCRDAAARLAASRWTLGAAAVNGTPAGAIEAEGRWVLLAADEGALPVTGLDSIGLVEPDDAAAVLVIGSHGALHGGDPSSALAVDAIAAFFHDAGRGKDDVGVSRLPVLAARRVPAATVDYRTARIGDARSMWASGRLSCINEPLAALGAREGMMVRDAVERLRGRG